MPFRICDRFLLTVQIDQLARASAGQTARAVAPDAANSGSSGQVASSSKHNSNDGKRTQRKGAQSCRMHQTMAAYLVTGRKLFQTQRRPLAPLLGVRQMAVVTTTTAAAMTIVLLLIGLP